ncbi:MAG TPA: hypothetical protein VHF90_07215 [Thermoleophilaceae bacterium]|nr:hypothetical protein [Thermoleophilaceae bacterium]
MGTEPEPLTVVQAVRRAVEACSADADQDSLARLLEAFEDDDRPIAAVQALTSALADAQADIDPELEDPALSMAVATTLYLAYRRDMDDADDDDLLRTAARAEWEGDPPEAVVDWLAAQGVRI